MAIHPTAVIDPQAELDTTVQVGPYTIIEGLVRIGADTVIKGHACLSGWTEIGRGCEINPFAVIGAPPQDFHYKGERSYTRIGNNVMIREGATVHRGTQPESTTSIGDECLLMAYAHVGHNCEIRRGAKVYNMAAVSGHVVVEENAIISGYALIHQFARIGRLAFIAGACRVKMDVPPFMTAFGESTIVQYNSIGMRRNSYEKVDIDEIRECFRILYRSRQAFQKSVAQVAARIKTRAGRELVDFLKGESLRGFCIGTRHHRPRDAFSPESAG
jgi:UDP-N-acetylglucosamine acyltransferase